jgi:hypothetical protein
LRSALGLVSGGVKQVISRAFQEPPALCVCAVAAFHVTSGGTHQMS